MSDPSVAVAEAFKQFSQATVSALRVYEQGTRARLSQAEDDLRALRRERDDALRDLNASREQTQVWVAEVDKWKSEANKAIVVNTHQAELVNQLRQEAQQWKDQCLRLEETLRGEIKAWKDQFLRVDAEHARLLNQQLSAPSSQVRVPRTPFTVRHRLPRRPPQQNTLAPQDDSTPKCIPVPLPGDSSATSSATKHRASASVSSCSARVDNKPAPTKAPLPRVVRRVQAFIEVPVKEEEQEDLEPERPDSALLLQPPSTSRAGVRRRKSSASSRRVSRRVPSDASDSGAGDGEPQPTGGGGGDEYVDEEEVENAIASSSPGPDGKAVPWGKKHIRHLPDEEDDELMMYAKKVRLPHEVHIPRPPRPKSVTNVAALRTPATDTSARKRRNEVMNSTSITRVKRRK
ncbi:hypothetical protein H4582DRAFT_1922820 [Lactarius indigo]|nr:hypothetical protein H4582DRAFT_1922820 [Lactarius indigo]